MRFNKHQTLTLTVIFVLSMSFIGVILGSVVITAMAHSESSPWYISLSGMERTATPFQPNSFANILEDGSIELIPQPMFTPTPVPVIPEGELPENQVNIIMLGADDFGSGNFRTDVIMLLSINPKHQTASLISFPRDLYVTIPGYWSNRINTVWQLGGFPLLQETFQVNFGFRPEYYMMVNYNGFKDVVNSIGGIDITVSEELQDSCHFEPNGWCVIEPGEHHMEGNTALWYARSRLTTSDFDRNRRAQEVVVAIFKKAVNLNMLVKVPELYGLYREYVDTDIPLTKVLTLLPMAKPLMTTDNIRRFSVSNEMVTNWITYEGAWVLMPNYDAISDMLNEALYRNE
jgi:LCP family protein required for cell wall assembly